MTLEEMKQELEKNGYSVKKRGPDTRIASDVWQQIFSLCTYDLGYRNYERERRKELTRNHVRQRVKAVYGYKAFSDIPDDEMPEIKDFMLIEGLQYIRKKTMQHWEGRLK